MKGGKPLGGKEIKIQIVVYFQTCNVDGFVKIDSILKYVG